MSIKGREGELVFSPSPLKGEGVRGRGWWERFHKGRFAATMYIVSALVKRFPFHKGRFAALERPS